MLLKSHLVTSNQSSILDLNSMVLGQLLLLVLVVSDDSEVEGSAVDDSEVDDADADDEPLEVFVVADVVAAAAELLVVDDTSFVGLSKVVSPSFKAYCRSNAVLR